MIYRFLMRFVILAAICGFSNSSVFGADALKSVNLAWDPSPAADLAGYRLYFGTQSKNYTSIVEAGSATSAVAGNLLAGVTYYFAVTTVVLAGLESPFSTEISYTVPASPKVFADLALTITSSGQAQLSGTAPAGYQYDVLMTTNLSDWRAIGSVTGDSSGSILFTDTSSPLDQLRLYRLRQTAP